MGSQPGASNQRFVDAAIRNTFEIPYPASQSLLPKVSQILGKAVIDSGMLPKVTPGLPLVKIDKDARYGRA
jgi:hypothetical protein